MKKLIVAAMIAAMTAGMMTGCGNTAADTGAETAEETVAETEAEETEETETEAVVGMANPVQEVSEDELVQMTGIDLPAPEGATDVSYQVITSDETTIAQMKYTMDGQEYFMRACLTGMTTLENVSEMDVDAIEATGFDLKGGNIAGLYYQWSESTVQDVAGRYAICNVSEEDGAGYISWIDGVPGILYNLGMTENATAEKLAAAANTAFTELQGDSDGDVVDEVTEEYPDYQAFAGEYQDSVSGRAMATVVENEDQMSAKVTVSWADSASSGVQWVMDVTYDGEKLNYNDCTETYLVYGDDGNVESETAIDVAADGYFEWSDDGKMSWTGASEESCQQCVFERME